MQICDASLKLMATFVGIHTQSKDIKDTSAQISVDCTVSSFLRLTLLLFLGSGVFGKGGGGIAGIWSLLVPAD